MSNAVDNDNSANSSPRSIKAEEEAWALQVQQFLDEWMFRILHCGMALTWDREESVLQAMLLFEAGGMQQVGPEEKRRIVSIDDDEEMCMEIVRLMPTEMKKNLDSFFLQLQLAVSTAARVRGVIEEGTEREVAVTMEDSESAGISQTILKKAVIAACQEVSEIKETHDGWNKSMKVKLGRLQEAADEAKDKEQELLNVQRELMTFGGDQNKKTTDVIMSMSANNEKVLLRVAVSAWIGYYTKYKGEERIHKKWQAQIDHAEAQLLQWKLGKTDRVKGVMGRQYLEQKTAMMAEIIKEWVKYVALEKEEKAIAGAVKEAEDKLKSLKAGQKENAKKAMMKVAGGSDAALLDVCWTEWLKFLQDIKKDKAFHDQVRATEERLKEYQAKGKDGAKSVLNRMGGGTDTGLVTSCFNGWVEEVAASKKGREVEDQINAANSKFVMLKNRQQGTTHGRVQSANELESTIICMQVFMNWHTQTRLSCLVQHYGVKMDKKKHQLEQVQQMFKTFATQLEQGIGNTPRSQRKSDRRGGSEASRPPLPS